MAFEVLAWNIKDAYSDPYRSAIITAAIERESPDVAVLSEAYAEHSQATLDDVREDLYKKGYETCAGLYDDADGRRDRHGLMVLYRRELFRKAGLVRLASRNAIRGSIVDPETEMTVDTIGVHMDDRSEKSRQAMVGDLRKVVGVTKQRKVTWPFVLWGDINSDPGTSAYAMALRAARPFAAVLPKQDPNPEAKYNKLLRTVSLVDRSGQMGSGKTLRALYELGLRGAIPGNLPTIPAENPKLQVDHILVNDDIHVKAYRVEDYNAAADHGLYTPVSDHRAIAAILQVRPR